MCRRARLALARRRRRGAYLVGVRVRVRVRVRVGARVGARAIARAKAWRVPRKSAAYTRRRRRSATCVERARALSSSGLGLELGKN